MDDLQTLHRLRMTGADGMSVRKRAWTTSLGVAKEARVVDDVDDAGTRRLKTFAKKKGRR